MGYAVELYFDPSSEQLFREAWEVLASAGITSTLPDLGARPHLSLAVFGDVAYDRLNACTRQFAMTLPPMRISLCAVGTFPTPAGVVYVAPLVTGGLLEIHRLFAECLARHKITADPYYRFGHWVPHCTMASEVPADRIGAAVETLRTLDLFGHHDLLTIGTSEFRPFRELDEYPLSGRK